MKRIFSWLIKIGILAGLVFAGAAMNPGEASHRKAIAAKQASLEEKDVLGQTEALLYKAAGNGEEGGALTYHNYFVCSKVTGPEKEMLSFGLLKRVFVTKSEL